MQCSCNSSKGCAISSGRQQPFAKGGDVHDVAVHLLGNDLGRLSVGRDGYSVSRGVNFVIEGPSGSRWRLRREKSRWRLTTGSKGTSADAHVTLDQEVAWRLMARMERPELAASAAQTEGAVDLAWPALNALAVMTSKD